MSDVTQVWYMYAGDASAAGKVDRLHTWWDQLNTFGPKFGYFTNPSKTRLVAKGTSLFHAVAAFADMGLKVTSEGRW